jgi:hypothetical protein
MTAKPKPDPGATTAKRPNLRLVPPPPKLTAKNAREHAAADAKVTKAKKALDDAVRERDKLRDRDRKKLPAGEEIVVGGVLLKRTTYTYDTFSLKDFKTAGHKVTAQMRKFVKPQDGERWTVKRAK